jgi:hypothetical protein
MMSILGSHGEAILIVAYVVANEIFAANPKLVANSLVQVAWNALKSTVAGHPLPTPKV